MNRYILLLFLVPVLILGFTPTALAGQYEWQVTTGQDGIHEIISIQDLDLNSSTTDGWECTMGEDAARLERIHEDWYQYSEQTNGLPVKTEIKNYIIFSKIVLTYDNSVNANELFDELVSNADGDISFQVAGIINQSSASEVNNLDRDPTALWHLTSGQGSGALAQSAVFLEVITFNGLMISLTILLLGFTGITIWYLTYIRRVNKLIAEEYSLTNIERLLKQEDEDSEENQEK